MPNHDRAAASTFCRFRAGLSNADRRVLVGMAVVIGLLHVVGFAVLLGAVAPEHYRLGGSQPVFGVGVGLLAYTFGLRHAFDADHVAAVDNTTRKLLADARVQHPATASTSQIRKPLSVGFWFSLGHSTVVFTLALLLSAGVKKLAGQVDTKGSALHETAGVVGATVSGAFLWLLGVMNLIVLVGIMRVFRELREGRYDERQLEAHLNNRGFMNRMLGGLTRSVRKPWHIYPVGVLFGLGFDTATEVGLLVLAGGAAVFNLPFYAILVLPVLFAAGMCLMDTIDGVFMSAAYEWAFAKPVRKIYYNITMTAISVAVALVIGTIELAGVVASRAGITQGPVAAIGSVPLNDAGYAIVALFAVAWAAAVLVWRLGRFDDRWPARMSAGIAPTDSDPSQTHDVSVDDPRVGLAAHGEGDQ